MLEQRLQGRTYKEIAAIHGIKAPTVFEIVDRWCRKIQTKRAD